MQMIPDAKIRETEKNGFLLHELVKDVKLLKPVINLAVDLGGGAGDNMKLLELKGVRIRKKKVFDLNPKKVFEDIEYYKIDLNCDRIPLENDSIDLVLAVESIEHLVNTDFFLHEVKRILASDGLAIITTPNLAWYPNVVFLLLGLQPIFTEVSTKKIYGRFDKQEVGHIRVFTYKSLKEVIIDKGFEVIKLKSVLSNIVPKKLILLTKIVSKILPHMGCNSYLIARKIPDKK